MKNKINIAVVNATQCASGKTRNWIYPLIPKLLATHQKVLLVVPSIELQKQYEKAFDRDSVFYKPVIINRPNMTHPSVNAQIFDAISKAREFICITHEAFKLCNLPPSVQNKYILILDEVFDPSDFTTITPNNDAGETTGFRYKDFITIKYNEELIYPDGQYVEVICKDLTPYEAIDEIRDNKHLQTVCRQHYLSYMRVEDYKMIVANKDLKQFQVHQLLKPDIMYYRKMYIAGAAFDQTFMSKWMDKFMLTYIIKPEHKFIPHYEDVTYHIPDTDFIWSTSKQQNCTNIIAKYHNYLSKQNGLFIGIKNNKHNEGTPQVEYIGHNVHGVNSYRTHNCVSIESAINTNHLQKDFYKQILGITSKAVDVAYSTYGIYQTIMRGCIREHKPIDVYMLDTRHWELLQAFIPGVNTNTFDINYTPKPAGRPVVLTPKQKALIKQLNNSTAYAIKKGKACAINKRKLSK